MLTISKMHLKKQPPEPIFNASNKEFSRQNRRRFRKKGGNVEAKLYVTNFPHTRSESARF